MVDITDALRQGLEISSGPVGGVRINDPFSPHESAASSALNDISLRQRGIEEDKRAGALDAISMFDMTKMAVEDRNTLSNLTQFAVDTEQRIKENTPAEDFDRNDYLTSLGVGYNEWENFDGLNSQATIDRRASRMSRRAFIDETIAANGVAGFMATAISEFAEPTNYILALRGAGFAGKAGVKGAALRTSAEAAASETVIQAAIQLNQPEQTVAQSFMEVGAATIGGALLGAGGYKAAELIGISKDRIAKSIVTAVNAEETTTPNSIGALASAGAQQAQVLGEGVRLSGGKAFKAAVTGTKGVNPTLRGLESKSTVVAEGYSKLLDTNFSREASALKEDGSFQAIPTSAEALQIQIHDQLLASSKKVGSESYLSYVGVAPGFRAKAMDKIKGGDLRRKLTRSGLMGEEDFFTLVGKAMIRSDDISGHGLTRLDGTLLTSDEINFINAAARAQRKHVMEPARDLMVQAKLLDEDVSPEFAASYLMRKYEIGKIQARPDKWEAALTPWAKKLFRAQKTEILEELKIKDLDEARRGVLEEDLMFFENEDNFLGVDGFLTEVAETTAQHITSGGNIGLGKFSPSKRRGSMKEILLTAEDVDIEDFL